jgi:hypothetical protein
MRLLVITTPQNNNVPGPQLGLGPDDMTTLSKEKGESMLLLWRGIHNRLLRYSMLPALSLDSILHLDVLDWSYTSKLFNEFVNGLLDNMNPFPAQNSVLVMDNASIHKSLVLQQMVEAR